MENYTRGFSVRRILPLIALVGASVTKQLIPGEPIVLYHPVVGMETLERPYQESVDVDVADVRSEGEKNWNDSKKIVMVN